MRALFAVFALIASLALLAGCGDDDEGGEEEAAGGAGCEEVEAPPAKDTELQAPSAKEPTAAAVVFETSCGSFTVELDPETNPQTAASFQYMAAEGVYDDTPVTRVAPDFVVQAGDPTGSGAGTAGYTITEPPPRDLFYERGAVAMAKSAAEPPGTSGSQFFIVVAPADAGLPPDYALVGNVSEGLETVEAIAALNDGSPTYDDAPTQTVVIETATVEE